MYTFFLFYCTIVNLPIIIKACISIAQIIPMLTDPESHGGSRDDVFEVICPSIPGYGFSEAPHKQGTCTPKPVCVEYNMEKNTRGGSGRFRP